MLHPGEFVLGSTVERVRLPARSRRSPRGQVQPRQARAADPLDGRVRGRRLGRSPDPRALQRRQPPHHLVPGDEDRPDQLLEDDDACRRCPTARPASGPNTSTNGARPRAATSRTSATPRFLTGGEQVLTRYPIGLAVTRRRPRRSRACACGASSGSSPRASQAPDRTASWSTAGQGRDSKRWSASAGCFKWTVPGLAHAFTFWGFTVLILTIIEAYGDLFEKNFAIPGIGHSAFIGFVEDFFACAVLVALRVFSVIRLRSSPKRKERASRFYGSHTGDRVGHPRDDRPRHHHPAHLPGGQTNTGDFPYGWWAFASHGLGRALHPLGRGGQPDDRDRLRRPEHRRDHVLSGARRVLQAPSHLHGTLERRLQPPAVAASAPSTRPLRSTSRQWTRTRSSGRAGSSSSPGSSSWISSPAPSAGAARASARPGTPARRSPPSSSSWTFATSCSKTEHRALVPERHRRRCPLGLYDVRGLCRGVPGRHRARRRHHRHAPLRGPDRVPLSERGRPHAAQRREQGRPLGPRGRKAPRMD